MNTEMRVLATALPAASTQARVVHALMLREIKSRFGRQKLGYLWAVFEPAAFVALFAFIFSLLRETSLSGMPIVLFMLTGIAPFIVFRNTMQSTVGAIEQNRVVLTFPQVTVVDLVIARALLEIATLTVVFFLLLGAAHMMGYTVEIEDPLQVLLALGCLAFTGLGAGAIFASVAPLFRSVQNIVSIAAGRPLFFTSGLFFTAEMLPEEARNILLLNPILHMIEWLRSAFFVEFESQYMDVGYAVETALVTVFLGLLMLRGLNKRILAAV